VQVSLCSDILWFASMFQSSQVGISKSFKGLIFRTKSSCLGLLITGPSQSVRPSIVLNAEQQRYRFASSRAERLKIVLYRVCQSDLCISVVVAELADSSRCWVSLRTSNGQCSPSTFLAHLNQAGLIRSNTSAGIEILPCCQTTEENLPSLPMARTPSITAVNGVRRSNVT